MSSVTYPVPGWEYNAMQRDLMLSDSTIETVVDDDGRTAGRFRLGCFALCCGRASGKSYGVMRAALKDAFLIAEYKSRYPDRYRSCNPVVSIAVCCPTAQQYEENLKVLTTLLSETAEHNGVPDKSLYGYRRQDKKWWLLREGFIDIQFISLYEPNSVRSMNIDVLVFDEAAFADRDEEVWAGLRGCLYREATIPRIYLCSSPNGKANSFFQYWKSFGGKEDCKYARNKARIWTRPDGAAKAYWFTSYDNSRNSSNFGEFDKEREENAATYNAERLAEFSASKAGERVLGDWSQYTIDSVTYRPNDPVSIGVDCSMMGDDYTVITVVDPQHKTPLMIERGQKWDAPTTISKIKDVVARFPSYRGIWIDANGPAGSWWSMLRDEGLTVTPIYWSNKDKLKHYQTVKTQLDLGKIKILDPYKVQSLDHLPQGERLRDELKAFLREWEDTLISKHKAGYHYISHTGSGHDDIVCAWVMATYPWFSGRSYQQAQQPGANAAKQVHRSILQSLV